MRYYCGAQYNRLLSGHMVGVRLVQSVDVVEAPDLTISEYIGRVASGDTCVSSCLCSVRQSTKESPQTPEFDEYVMVLEGEIHVHHDTNLQRSLIVRAGQGFILHKGTRVQWAWPGPCKYIAICLPAFSPAIAGREEAREAVAKTQSALQKLRALHATSSARFACRPSGHIVSLGVAVGLGAVIGVICARGFSRK